jgi:hypothetical protein
MNVINLTPHAVQVYAEYQYTGLVSKGTTITARSVEGQPLAQYPSQGCARIETATEPAGHIDNGIPIAKTTYGAAVGIPEGIGPDDVIIVSLPMKSMAVASNHPLAGQMVSPYKVVRSEANGSLVLGCMGFTY